MGQTARRLSEPVLEVAGRQSPAALEIARGTGRLLCGLGLAAVYEVPLASGRRADVTAVSETGEIWIIEIKSCLADFRSDSKWPEYRDYCDRLLFAVSPGFPCEALPVDAGLILADGYAAEIAREGPLLPLAAARRKAMLIRVSRTAAQRLHAAMDPGLER
jgi:hypothetical protein